MKLERLLGMFLILVTACFFIACNEEESKTDGDAEQEEQSDLLSVTAPPNWNPNPHRTPKYLHMTYQHDPANHVTMQWQTEDVDEKKYIPKVWFIKADELNGVDPYKFDENVDMPYAERLVATGGNQKYCRLILCVGNVPLDGQQWEVELEGLEPNTHYYYRVGTWESFDEDKGEFVNPDLSPVYHFQSGLPKGSAESFVFGFGSDSQGWFPDTGDKLTHIRSHTGREARFWLHGGDLTEWTSQENLWDFFEVFSPLLHYFPLMATQGNHDAFDGLFYGEFAMPVPEGLPENLHELIWSFNYGNVHFLGYKSITESLVEVLAPWVEKDLKAASSDPDITWIIVYAHHPTYSSAGTHGSTDYIQTWLMPFFDQYHADVVFSGHVHDYERSKPMKGGQIVAPGEGTLYIVSGGFYSQKWYQNGTADFTEVSVNGDIKNYVIMTADTKTLTGVAYSGAHDQIDTFTLTKE